MDDAVKITISKLAAARRQLDCAIELWFRESDQISIHTLAAAAYQIIHDINQQRGPGKTLLYDLDMVVEEYRREWIAAVKGPVNFFKHADRDAEETIEFSPFGNLTFMAFCARGLQILGEPSSDHVSSLEQWITINRPDLITEKYREQFYGSVQADDVTVVRGMSKSDFFDAYFAARAAQTI